MRKTMTMEPVKDSEETTSSGHNLRVCYGVSVALLLVAFALVNYVAFNVSHDSMSRDGFLHKVAVSYDGIYQVEYGAPRSFSLDVVTVDGLSVHCDEPNLVEMNEHKPLECDNGAIVLKHRDA